MIDAKVETYPDIIKMMRTCKLKDFRQEHEDLIIDNFSVLYQEMKETGQILEETFDRLKFPPDTGYSGQEVCTYHLILYSTCIVVLTVSMGIRKIRKIAAAAVALTVLMPTLMLAVVS